MYLLQMILDKLPELEQKRTEIAKRVQPDGVVHKWKILDANEHCVLLEFSFRDFDLFGEHVNWNHSSCFGIISLEGSSLSVRYLGFSKYTNSVGILHTPTHQAILARYKEYDNLVDRRTGQDELLILNYQTGDSKSLFGFSFGIGSYMPGRLSLSINNSRNWVALGRVVKTGWQEHATATSYIYDLADSAEIASGALEGVTTINSMDLPGSGQFLVVTDEARADHVFKISNGKFVRISGDAQPYKWKVAISFSGKDRKTAELIARGLKSRGISVFYDEFEKVNILGKDLYQYLFEVYSKRSEYCILLLSEHYASGKWTLHELKAAQARALESEREFILPVRIDDAKIPGLPPQIGYLDLRQEDIQRAVHILSEKVKGFKA